MIVVILLIILFAFSTGFAETNGEKLLQNCIGLFEKEKYELIINELDPLIYTEENYFSTTSSYLDAVNLLADSYRLANKYTEAVKYYSHSAAGLDPHGEYCDNILNYISIEKGYDLSGWDNIHERNKNYYSGIMGPNPVHY